MDFLDLSARAAQIRHRYAQWEQEHYGRSWTEEEIALGLVGDVGDLMKLVQGKAGVRPRADLDEALAHELADCLWAVMTLASAYGVDLEASFIRTMDHLEQSLAGRAAGEGPSVISDSGAEHVVAGVLVEGDRVLLGHRSPSRRWYPDVWDLPGGHIEPDETSRAALERELREELDVVVVVAKATDRIQFGDVVLDVWTVSEWTGVPVNRAPDEHDEVRWFTAGDLPVAALAHPELESVLRRALAER